MYLFAFQFAFSLFGRCYFTDQKRLEAERKQGDAGLIKRVLSANFCVDERGEPRSAPLLLGYEPQVKSFLEGPTVPRSEAFEILPRAPYTAQPAEVEQPEDFLNRIPTGQVYAMAPPLNPFKLMGKTADAGPSKKRKGQARGKGKETGAPKKLKKLPEDTPVTETISVPVPEQEAVPSPQAVHVVVESEQEEELQPRQKEGRTEPSSIPAEGPSSHHAAWDPALLFGPNPISVRDTILDHSDADASARVAHGLSFAACLPGDMERWAGTQPGTVFCQMTHGLMMVSTSLLTLFLCI
jgi:hypothetical protein